MATVTPSGSIPPTGSVTFTFYSNGTCEGTGTAMGTIALDGANPGVAHPSTSTAALTPGTYAFQASWPGDTNFLTVFADVRSIPEHLQQTYAKLRPEFEKESSS